MADPTVKLGSFISHSSYGAALIDASDGCAQTDEGTHYVTMGRQRLPNPKIQNEELVISSDYWF